MIAFDNALAKALAYDPDMKHYWDYENAHEFSRGVDVKEIGPSPYVIVKATGEAVPLVSAIAEGVELGELIREGDIELLLAESAALTRRGCWR